MGVLAESVARGGASSAVRVQCNRLTVEADSAPVVRVTRRTRSRHFSVDTPPLKDGRRCGVACCDPFGRTVQEGLPNPCPVCTARYRPRGNFSPANGHAGAPGVHATSSTVWSPTKKVASRHPLGKRRRRAFEGPQPPVPILGTGATRCWRFIVERTAVPPLPKDTAACNNPAIRHCTVAQARWSQNVAVRAPLAFVWYASLDTVFLLAPAPN